ncbi:hypothetical protein QYE76_036159 [Lolium multiflorum]|uniref:Uncharacterized protein n=1 Tax=Lolium multiflorum TaxID=4521 RepID=A0AAD8VP49_LOLMU|nr:hypothetical protein QYE76_036159 [Lolium multiflorum]
MSGTSTASICFLFPSFCPSARHHPTLAPPYGRSAPIVGVGSVFCAGEQERAPPRTCRLFSAALPVAPPFRAATTCSVNCAVGFYFRRYCAWPLIQFVPRRWTCGRCWTSSAEVVDSSSDEESDESTQTLATTAASMIHEFTSNPGPQHRGSVKGAQKPVAQQSGRAGPPPQGLLPPHQSDLPGKIVPAPIQDVKGPVLGHSTGRQKLRPVLSMQARCNRCVRLHLVQKCSAAIRMLSYGMPADIFDEYLRMGESTCLEAIYRFCRAVIAVFGEYYCREPTIEDTRRLMSINESRGFPGMIGSIDCMHWQWKNCPFGWQGAYNGHEEGKTVILEAVISQDLWIWHSFFGMAGSNNDINVLHRSPVFERLMQGKAPR